MAILKPSVVENLIARINRLRPDSHALWGKMTVNQMMAHCAASIKMAYGEIPSKLRTSKWVAFTATIIYIEFLRFPKYATAPAEINHEKKFKSSVGFEEGKSELIKQLKRIADTPDTQVFQPHPIFHQLSHRQWGKLALKHFDHHLRQFGV